MCRNTFHRSFTVPEQDVVSENGTIWKETLVFFWLTDTRYREKIDLQRTKIQFDKIGFIDSNFYIYSCTAQNNDNSMSLDLVQYGCLTSDALAVEGIDENSSLKIEMSNLSSKKVDRFSSNKESNQDSINQKGNLVLASLDLLLMIVTILNST